MTPAFVDDLLKIKPHATPPAVIDEPELVEPSARIQKEFSFIVPRSVVNALFSWSSVA